MRILIPNHCRRLYLSPALHFSGARGGEQPRFPIVVGGDGLALGGAQSYCWTHSCMLKRRRLVMVGNRGTVG
ncbi:hypothetical protein VNO78_07650 [Psophocarpus tetragonolobus]|uniref:Uncharacterized protein n=1 Tax=Psophocarpus tetragonolobus TaxID=3891 RepID=A0AAN9SUK6_PSOTE